MKQIIATIFVVIPFALFAQRNVNTVDTLPVKIFIDNNVLGKSVDGFVVIKGRKRNLLDAEKMRMKTQNLPYAINCPVCPKCPVTFTNLNEDFLYWPNQFDPRTKFISGNDVKLFLHGENINIKKNRAQ